VGPIGTLRRQGSAQEDTDFGLADIDLVSQEVDVVSVPRKLRISSGLGSSFGQAAVRPLSRSSGDLPVALRPGAGLAGALGAISRRKSNYGLRRKYSAYPSQDKSTCKRLAEAPIEGGNP